MLESLSTKLNRVAEKARKDPGFQFRTIAHLIDVGMFLEAFGELRKDAAAGIDGMTAVEYGRNLRANLTGLHRRMKEGRYRAQPLRRVYIQKEDGKERPLAIPVLEDKIAQKAVVNLLSRIYEQDFLPCSYGYRPRRGAHDALDDIWKHTMSGRVNYVLEADIQDYFGSIVRSELQEMLQKRIGEKSLHRLIGKWLRVGVIEDGRLLTSEDGTHQGSVISPLLANIYLHEVLDLWVERMVKPVMRGEVRLFRFADDFIVCFERRDDAERFQQVLPKRFAKYGLKLHPEKTRLIEFGRRKWGESRRTGRKPPTFNFLGFTHYCGNSREGRFVVKVKTMGKRLGRKLKEVYQWCRRNRHLWVRVQWQRLSEVLRGHYQYYGRRTNYMGLDRFYRAVRRLWRKCLGRRSNDGYLTWERYNRLLRRYPLPVPRITRGAGVQTVLIGEMA